MKLIVGLGNPGREYLNTRHNVGYLFVDEFKELNRSGFVAKKTDTFMNSSGLFVVKQLKENKLSLENLYIVHDDLDILLGSYKIQFGRGPKDHNGISSIDNALGTKNYWHIRIGVDKRDPHNRVLGEEYVLQNFTKDEKLVLERVLKEVCKKLVTL